MFNAKYFQYDGIMSSIYGLQIADFNDNSVIETEFSSPTLSIQKAPGAVRFFYDGVNYDSPPSCEFSVVSEEEISASVRRELFSWLIGRSQFMPLEFFGGDNEGYTYYCVFTSAKTIWVNGRCHGLRLTAQFDSIYARGTPSVISVSGGVNTVQIENKSDIKDDYVYPVVEFVGSFVDIVNTTDDSSRRFSFTGTPASGTVTVDNELRCITGAALSSFISKNWLRLRPGVNSLTISSAGAVTIICPTYAMIGY